MEDYEKLYKEALERCRELYNEAKTWDYPQDLEDYEYIFPVLKELDDEGIRKELIEFVKSRGGFKQEYIAWLEKQKPAEFCEEDEKIRKAIYIYLDWLDGRKDYAPRGEYSIRDMVDWLEKQGEQKVTYTAIVETGNGGINALVQGELSADKIEPKFKAGDWITNGRYIKLIVGIDSDYPFYMFKDGTSERIKDIDKKYHLWTIQDAKDGDVLAFDCTQDNGASHFEKIVIFKGLNKDGVEGYGSTYINGQQFFHDEVITYSKTWTTNLHPATKEQCDLLFQKIKDAGYEWDDDKKRLRKIEKQKPVEWSEEDDKMLQTLVLGVGGFILFCGIPSEDIVNWLKSLQQKFKEE